MYQGSDEEDQGPCVMCQQQNQQMLMLSCVHDPCVNCAATHYVENQPLNSPVYTCSRCGQETELDQSSVVELQRVYYSLHPRKKVDYRRNTSGSSGHQRNEPRDRNVVKTSAYQHRSRERDRDRDRDDLLSAPPSKYYAPPPVSQPSYVSNPKKSSLQPQYPCPDHPEEELTYFCFSCNNSICPECAIHGYHKEHEVQTTRKAIKQIRHLLGDDKQKLDQEAGRLMGMRDRQRKQGRELTEQNRKDQEIIHKKITHLRNALNEKEKEFIRVAEVNTQRNIQQVRTEGASNERSLQEIAAVKRSIDTTLKKEDIVILQEYTKRNQEVSQLLDHSDRERVRYEEQMLKSPPRVVDFGQFQEDLDRILADVHALKLSTLAYKA